MASISQLLDEIARSSIRCVDEAWKETPRPKRDGTKMILVSEPLFNRLEKAVNQLVATGEYRHRRQNRGGSEPSE